MGYIKKGIKRVYSYKKIIIMATLVLTLIASGLCVYKYFKSSNVIQYDLGYFHPSNNFNGVITENGYYLITPPDGEEVGRDFCAESSYTLLQKGNYTIVIAYESDSDHSVFVQAGDSVYEEFYLPAGNQLQYIDFSLDQSVEDARTRFYYGGSGYLKIRAMLLSSDRPIFSDWLFIMVIMWVAVAFIIRLEYMYFNNKLTKGHLMEILFVAVISILSVPYVILVTKGIILGYDTNAHNMRIEGLKDAILGGQFPVVIMPSLCNGYGSIEPMMYPSLFLYPLAFLRILNVSAVMVSKFGHIVVNLLTCSTCYVCAKKITRSRQSAGIALIAYAFSKFHLMTIGCRDWTFGMGIAAIFFFVVLIGVYEIYLGEREEWPYLTIGMWGIMNSHILTTLFAAAVVGVFALVYLKKSIIEGRLKYFIYAVLWSVPVCIYRIYTLLDSMINNELNTSSLQLDIYEESLYSFSSVIHKPMIFLGVAGIAVIFIYLCVVKNRFSNGNKLAITSLFISVVCIALMSTYLPWKAIFSNKILGSVIGYVQFPNRMMQIITPLIAISIGIAYRNLKRNNNISYKVCMMLILSTVAISSIWGYRDEIDEISTRGRAFSTRVMGDVLSFPGMTDYVPEGETFESFAGRTPYYSSDEITINEESYKKNGVNIEAEIICTKDDSYIDFPIFGYKGYVCENQNGQQLVTGIGEHSRLRVFFDKSDAPLYIKIYYKVPVIYYILLAVSYISLFIMTIINKRFLGRIKARLNIHNKLDKIGKVLENINEIDLKIALFK